VESDTEALSEIDHGVRAVGADAREKDRASAALVNCLCRLHRGREPAAIFATNTSSISVTRIAAASKDPSRLIGMHFFNPVPLMQLVEVIRPLQTKDEVCDVVVNLVQSLGKTARVSKDSYGFVVNRVLIPMINEAINCVHEGLASPEDIDVMMKLGANHPMGPLALADLIGLDVVLDIMQTLYEGFDDPKYRPSPLLKQMHDAGYLGRKSGRGFFLYQDN
jgi:3-hydroxybutyryl-CoA dehydrogenase